MLVTLVAVTSDPHPAVDAAYGWAWHERIRGEQYFLSGGRPASYQTGTVPLVPPLGPIVGKSGRTTGLTQGRVTQIGFR